MNSNSTRKEGKEDGHPSPRPPSTARPSISTPRSTPGSSPFTSSPAFRPSRSSSPRASSATASGSIRTDRGTMEYVARLTALYQQYRAVGVNYNQAVKELHVHFTEKKALALLYRLEKLTLELVALSRRIVGLSEELKRHGGENQHR